MGGALGAGVYFAEHISYSLSYAYKVTTLPAYRFDHTAVTATVDLPRDTHIIACCPVD